MTPAGGRSLRVLLTNNTLAERAGSELYVLDLARALMVRGHLPVAYSTSLGAVAEELRRATVPVVSDLRDLREAPDIIHGQHHLDAMTAMLHFPEVPAIYICHGWIPWQEEPPKFPTIARYVAVDDLCRERLITRGIPPQMCHTIRNFVDLERFPAKPEIATAPRRAAIFSNAMAPGDPQVVEIENGCRRAGVTDISIIGLRAGTSTSDPGATLAGYDVVFAKGRAALEALAVGAAVVVSDTAGMAGLVTSGSYPWLRSLNFGVRTMQAAPICAAAVQSAVAGYDPTDVAAVRATVREQAGLHEAAERWIALYLEVLSESDQPPADRQAAHREMFAAAAAYLRDLSPMLKQIDILAHEDRSHRAQMEILAQRAQAAEQDTAGTATALRAARVERDAVAADRDLARAERDAVAAARADCEQHVAALVASRAWRAAERYRAARDGVRSRVTRGGRPSGGVPSPGDS